MAQRCKKESVYYILSQSSQIEKLQAGQGNDVQEKNCRFHKKTDDNPVDVDMAC